MNRWEIGDCLPIRALVIEVELVPLAGDLEEYQVRRIDHLPAVRELPGEEALTHFTRKVGNRPIDLRFRFHHRILPLQFLFVPGSTPLDDLRFSAFRSAAALARSADLHRRSSAANSTGSVTGTNSNS